MPNCPESEQGASSVVVTFGVLIMDFLDDTITGVLICSCLYYYLYLFMYMLLPPGIILIIESLPFLQFDFVLFCFGEKWSERLVVGGIRWEIMVKETSHLRKRTVVSFCRIILPYKAFGLFQLVCFDEKRV